MLLSVVLLQLGELFYCRLWVGGVCYYGMYYDLKKYLLLLRVALILELLYNSLLAVALGCVMLETALFLCWLCFLGNGWVVVAAICSGVLQSQTARLIHRLL